MVLARQGGRPLTQDCPFLQSRAAHSAAILSSVDNAIEKTQEVVDQVRTVKRRVMIDRFTSGLPGGMAPDGWVSSKLGSLARVNPEQLGGRTDPDYLMEYLDIAAIEQPGLIGGSRTLRFAEAPSRARRVVRNGDILVSTVRPYSPQLRPCPRSER